MKIDLHDKIQAVTAERQTIEKRLEHLNELERALKLLINEELRTPAPPQLEMALNGSNGHRPAKIGRTLKSRFIFEVLGDTNAHPLSELTQLAKSKGVQFGDKDPGRSLHFALIGLARNGYAAMESSGVWRLTPKAIAQLKAEGKIATNTETSSVAG